MALNNNQKETLEKALFFIQQSPKKVVAALESMFSGGGAGTPGPPGPPGKDAPTTPATTSALGMVKMGASVADAAETVTKENFNNLLKSLRDAGIISQ